MTRRRSVSFSVAILLSLAACAVPLESIYAPADTTGWKVAHAQDVRGAGNIVERIPVNETLQNWTKMVTVQFFENERQTPQTMMDRLRARMLQRCPGAIWNQLESDRTSVLYEWRIASCPGEQDQHELSRLLQGNDGLHRIAYTEKVANLPANVRARWIDTLKGAYVVKGGRENRVIVSSN